MFVRYWALINLRLPEKRRVLWVDALCINQADTTERNNQVSQMADIYFGSKEVFVWLGEGNEFTDRGMDFLGEISAHIKSIKDRVLKEERDRHQMYREWTDLFHSVHARHDSDECFAGIATITLARATKVQVGKKILPWECFEIFSNLYTVYTVHTSGQVRPEWSREYLMFRYHAPKMFCKADTIRVMRMKRLENIEIPLSWMVQCTLGRFATDPRDKIYAILGLINCGPRVSPDYSLSCNKVYTAAFRAMLEYFGDLRVYNYLQGSHPDSGKELPSWVPDFMALTTSRIASMVYIDGSSPNDLIQSLAVGLLYGAASVSYGKLIKSLMEFKEGDSILVLKGIPVDRISIVGKVAPDRHDTKHMRSGADQNSLKDTIIEWRSLVYESNGSYITGGSCKEAFWRTITLDSKVIKYHEGLTLQDNPRDRRRRLDRVDPRVPPQSLESENKLVEALEEQAVWEEGFQCSRRFFMTKKGYMGIGPNRCSNGDIVCVLLGGELPYVLRPVTNERYKMVGQCYMHGIMDGEVIRGAIKGNFMYKDFAIA
ncbi:Heterokaryon incompatibility protein (HET) domain containing protein [Hyaloscypha variabilis]